MANKTGIEWYRVPVPRDELRKLTARSDARALAQTVGFLLVLAATGTSGWLAWNAVAAGTFPIWGLIGIMFVHGTVWHFLRVAIVDPVTFWWRIRGAGEVPLVEPSLPARTCGDHRGRGDHGSLAAAGSRDLRELVRTMARVPLQ